VSDRYAIALPVGAGRMNFLLIVILGDGNLCPQKSNKQHRLSWLMEASGTKQFHDLAACVRFDPERGRPWQAQILPLA
jgi:hypothetical protein